MTTESIIPATIAALCTVLRSGFISATTPEGAAINVPFAIAERRTASGSVAAIVGYVRLDGATQAHINTVKWYGGVSYAKGSTVGCIARGLSANEADDAFNTLVGWVACNFKGAVA